MDCFEVKADGLYWATGRRAGKRCGRVKRDNLGKGYRQLKWQGKHHYEHRLIWQIMYGEIPKGMVVDHIDGNSENNAPENLRLLTVKQNNRSKRRTERGSKSGKTGVTFDKAASRWKAHIQVDGIHKNLGLFNCKTAAWVARKAADIKYGFDPSHGETRRAL